MADERFARWAAGVLRTARGRLEPRLDDAPEATVACLEEAIVATTRRRRRRRMLVGYGVVGVAAVAAVALVLRSPELPAPRPIARSLMTVEGRQPLAAGAAIETSASALTLLSSDGTRLVVGPHSALRLTRDDAVRWFRLVSGAVDLEVAKLPAGHRFVVETPDRQVEVKGTEFSVRVASPQELPYCHEQTVTRVLVEEGAVVVRGPDGAEEVIRAGGHWPVGCAVEAVSARVEAPAGGSASRPAAGGGGAHPSPSRASRPAPALLAPAGTGTPSSSESGGASTLAVENDLFSAAVRAERAGDRVGALRTLDDLILRYPASPLREAAIAERSKLAAAPPGAAPAPAGTR